MNIDGQRERCAKVMGWKRIDEGLCYDDTYDDAEGKMVMFCALYRPDENIQQADELKARLRELGYSYKGSYDDETKIFTFYIYTPTYDDEGAYHFLTCVCQKDSKVSEEAALTEAVAKMQKEGE